MDLNDQISDVSYYVKRILDILSSDFGFDRNDRNFDNTPSRVDKAFREIISGYKDDYTQILGTVFPSENYDQMIVVKDIGFYSTCAHHLMPFHGKVAVGYIPNEKTKKVVGLSKIPRLVRMFSRRFQIQERMTQQIANSIDECLEPRGVGVLVYDSIHLCSHMRGIEESHSTMETSALRGQFLTDGSVRSEFFSMVYGYGR